MPVVVQTYHCCRRQQFGYVHKFLNKSSNMSERNETLLSIENDEFYKQFLNSGAKNKLSGTLSITEQVQKLGEGIELLNRELQKQIVEKHDDLLRQANHATKLEHVLETMNVHVQNLFANAERLRGQINGPYNTLEVHTRVLGRLHLASHILRQVNRIQLLSRRLTNTNDPVQKGSLLQELEQLASDPDLVGIDAVTSELRNIRAQQQKIVKLTTGSLNQGIVNENVAQVTTALQIFLNLGILKSITQNIVDVRLEECRESLKTAFDVNIGVNTVLNKSKPGPGRATLTSSQEFRTRVWSDLTKAFSEEIYLQCKQVKFLQITLNGLNVQQHGIEIAAEFWRKLGENIVEDIKNAASAMQQMLEEDYPKLLKAYCEMIRKLQYEKFDFNRTILGKLENTYLSGALTRLLEPTQSIFNVENNEPTQEQIDSLIRIITSELSVSLVEESLSEKVAKNVSKCIKMYAVKTEQQLATGSEVAQVTGGSANSGQRLNAQLANSMHYFQVQVQRILSNMKDSLPTSCVNIINDSLQSLDTLAVAILQPLINSINSAIETILVTIHLETDWGKLKVSSAKISVPCSPYMRELSQFISRVYQTYLMNFENKDMLTVKCTEIAIRCIDLMVRHSTIIRPISEGGRLRLRSDYLQLEQSLKVICPCLTDLSKPYRLLKSMTTLITLTPSEIVESQSAGSCVPASTILFLLFTFAGAELTSPHQNTGWSVQKLSAWLDEHPSEADRLDLIAGALQRYEAIVRQKNSVNYDPVYPVMSVFLEAAVKNK